MYCSDIITFNTIADRGAIKDVGRALEMPLADVEEICKVVDDEDKYQTVKEKNKELFKYVDNVKGVIVSSGEHPCGLIVSPTNIEEDFGLCTASTTKYPISQINMKEVDSLNYVKLDLLKLDTIELIDNTCKLAGIPMATPDNLDVDDIKVWNSMRDDTTEIFQWSSQSGSAYLKELLSDETIAKFKKVNENVDRMELMSIGNSAIRPAGASYRNDLASGVVRLTGYKPIDDFLKPTFGYLVYQCQIIEFLNEYCGFTMSEADYVRKKIAKLHGTEDILPVIKDGGTMIMPNGKETEPIDGFIVTANKKYGIKKEEAEEIIEYFLQVILDASSYLFSRNHSHPYSYMGYACGYLRYYYPVEFCTAALNLQEDNVDRTTTITKYAAKQGIVIEAIKFRHSHAHYSCDAKEKIIYKGVASIKYLNGDIAERLFELGENQYDSFIDLLIDIKTTPINSKQLDILIKLDFFSEFGDINELLQQVKLFDSIYGKKQFKKDKAQELGYSFGLLAKYATKETEKMFTGVDSAGFLKEMVTTMEFPKTTIMDKINYENEHYGYIQLIDKTAQVDLFYVCDLKKRYQSYYAQLYRIVNGQLKNSKIRSRVFNKLPFEKGNLIYITEEKNEPVWRKVNDEWVQDPNTKENILYKWNLIK